MSENKAIDKANLELALSENNKRLLEHTDTADTELRQNLNMMFQYQKYLNTELDYIQICFPGDTTVNNVDVGTIIPFSTLAFSNNLDFDNSTYTIKLNAGKTYKITSHIRTLNSSGYFYFSTYNKTQNKIVGLSGCVETPSSYNNNVVNTPIKTILRCNEDTEIQFKITAINAARTIIFTGLSTIIVEEINRQIVIDPVEHVNTEYGLEDAPVGHIISHMGTKVPNHYLICDGSEYDILLYPELANHILDNFGSYNYFGGDGVNTFAVPDLRGEFLRGAGTATRDAGSGSAVGEHQDGTQHKTIATSKNRLFGYQASSNDEFPKNRDKEYITTGYNTYASTTKGNTYQTSNYYTSRPTNTSVLYCIKYEPTYYTSVQNTNYLSASLYSEEERIVGSWINGKPLYEKTIKCITPSSANTQTIIGYLPDNTEFAIIDGTIHSKAGSITPINWCQNNTTFVRTWARDYQYTSQENTIGMIIGANVSDDYKGCPVYIVARYTKTTDNENSFTNGMIKDYITSSENYGSSCTDEEINSAIAEAVAEINEEV